MPMCGRWYNNRRASHLLESFQIWHSERISKWETSGNLKHEHHISPEMWLQLLKPIFFYLIFNFLFHLTGKVCQTYGNYNLFSSHVVNTRRIIGYWGPTVCLDSRGEIYCFTFFLRIYSYLLIWAPKIALV